MLAENLAVVLERWKASGLGDALGFELNLASRPSSVKLVADVLVFDAGVLEEDSVRGSKELANVN